MKNENMSCSSGIWPPLMQQQIFRGLLDSFSYPGRISACADEETTACLAVLISLVDGETTLADPQQLLPPGLWPKLEARRTMPDKAAFILADGRLAPDLQPGIGTLEAPETGATLLLCIDELHGDMTGDVCLHLSGPGIRQEAVVSVKGLHPAWITSRNEWVSAFPLGVDMVLCDEHRFVALPRTTRVGIGDTA